MIHLEIHMNYVKIQEDFLAENPAQNKRKKNAET